MREPEPSNGHSISSSSGSIICTLLYMVKTYTMMKRQKLAALWGVILFISISLALKHIRPHLWRDGSRKENVAIPLPLLKQDSADSADLKLTNGHSLTLTVRLTATPKLIDRLYCWMLRSAAVFWSPKLGPITLILDAGSKQDQDFAARIHKQENSLMGLKFNILFEDMIPSEISSVKQSPLKPGYVQQLWSFFVMDLYINTSIIALTDADAEFFAPVTPENIFSDDKLRVMGNEWKRRFFNMWDEVTQTAIGKPMVANFMVYFPVYIWRSTITNCRNHILKHMNVSTFEEAFSKLIWKSSYPSPVCIVMSYAFYFEHDLYDWHIDVNNDLQAYNKRHMPPGFEVKPSDSLPYIHLTSHVPYVKKLKSLRDVYCEAKRHVDTLPGLCGHNTIALHLFEFDSEFSHLNTWCKGPEGGIYCNQLIQTHYQNFVKYYQSGMYDLDVKRVFAVERAASELNVTCQETFA